MNLTKKHLVIPILITLIIFTANFILTEVFFETIADKGFTNQSSQTAAVVDFNGSLIGHWKFDEGSGTTATDASGNGNTGTLVGGAGWTTGKIGQALGFAGIAGNYARMDKSPIANFSSPNTLCAWVNSTDFTKRVNYTSQTVANFYNNSNNSVVMQVSSNGKLHVNYNDNGVKKGKQALSSLLASNTWNHICYTYDGNSISLYVNNSAVSASAENYAGSNANLIGANSTDGGNWYGSIDDVRVYNRALPASEITELYNYTGSSGTPQQPPLVPPSDITPPPVISDVQPPPSNSQSGDYYDWNIRTDRYGKPAGIFDLTPFPITENTTSYKIRNDENPDGKTYFIDSSKIIFIDGNLGSNCAGSYSVVTRTCGSGSFNAYRTIAGGIAATSNGNYTILIRNGVYPETSIAPKSGIDDAHRYMLVGYNQERPVINGIATTNDSIIGNDLSYVTVQRLRIQDNYRAGIRTNGGTSCFNTVDVWLYNNDTYDFTNKKIWGDGNLYYLNSQRSWIFHSTSEHTYGHGFKIGDGASDNILEWSVAKDVGYWSGFPFNAYYGSSATGIDFPNDTGTYGYNNTIRYNIVKTALYYGVQLRGLPNFSFHHNEVSDTNKFDAVDMSVKGVSRRQVAIIWSGTYGSAYSNVIHDPGSINTPNLSITTVNNSSTRSINVFNNLIYGGNYSNNSPYGSVNALGLQYGGGTNTNVNIFNNSFYAGNNGNLILAGAAQVGGGLNLKNNIFFLNSNGTIFDFNGYKDSSIHQNNLYYIPLGNKGVTLDGSEIIGNPQWMSILSGNFSSGIGKLSGSSPAIDKGTNLGSIFSSDIINIPRPQGSAWDIGAYEYTGGGVVQPVNPPVTPSTPADFNHDGRVNATDFLILTSHWNQNNPTYDLNADGIVNSLDYVVMIKSWRW